MVSRWTPGLAQWLASPVVYVQIGLCPAVGHLNRLIEKKEKECDCLQSKYKKI